MKLKFIKTKKEAGDAISFIFKPPEKFSWTAGQFMVYFLPHEKEDIRGRQRFFTISSAPFEKHVMLTTRIFAQNPSSFKKALMNLEIGDEIDAKGPDGDFVLTQTSKQYVFIAGGIGITPYRSIILDLVNRNKPLNIELFYANKTDSFVFKDELKPLTQTHPNFKISYLISPQHIDKKYIEQNVKDVYKKIFYVSGPEPMVENLFEMLKGMGIEEENLKTDYFPGYDPI